MAEETSPEVGAAGGPVGGEENLRVFLSWSGGSSKAVAAALRGWLPLLSDSISPWMSEKDIPSGERWSQEVGKMLSSNAFGIICVTTVNLKAPWILFEAGALSKSFGDGRVCPYLLDVAFSDLPGPLGQFQSQKADYESTLALVKDINRACPRPLEDRILAQRFSAHWPQLEQALTQAQGELGQEAQRTHPAREPRPVRDILEELVGEVRSVGRRLSILEDRVVPPIGSLGGIGLIAPSSGPGSFGDLAANFHTTLPMLAPGRVSNYLFKTGPVEEPLSVIGPGSETDVSGRDALPKGTPRPKR